MAKGNTWKLADVDPQGPAANTQGIVVSGFGKLGHGAALFLELPDNCGGAWLKDVLEVSDVTPASALGGAKLPVTVSVAFTWSGLKLMGLSKNALASFSTPFRQGMFQEDRARRLGDRRSEKWLDTVLPDGPLWSGNIQPMGPDAEVDAYAVTSEPSEEPWNSKVSVHAMIMLCTDTKSRSEAVTTQIEEALAKHGARISHRLPLMLDVKEGQEFSREHFGFADGLSQPLPYDRQENVVIGGALVTEPDQIHGTPLGEFLMGYVDGHGNVAPGPLVRADIEGMPEAGATGLPEHDQALGFLDFGRNGSYMVVRQLRQEVDCFWASLKKAAAQLRALDPTAQHIDEEWLAERIIGRTKEGHILRPDGSEKTDPQSPPRNDFLFFEEDRHGLGCPLGSHVRRSNPRDGLAPKEEETATLLHAANNHRILRRGRKYTCETTAGEKPDVGLLFVCLNTDILRQFEFVQQTWLLNKDFSTLFEETDPLVGPDGAMTIPNEPLRYRFNVETYVKLVGGEYFFLPSVPALRYLCLLPPEKDKGALS